ncbi:hypothetical protein D9615_000610 [Tricholomella constricta]|uniref:Uncharacterized protein n=1 Tax=Tricholomella constricta TaxID=117010 RepID=A0A8H5HS84_9AGAR|nr:hypothetical protein D9615_000610 [Tricholomella constricta]
MYDYAPSHLLGEDLPTFGLGGSLANEFSHLPPYPTLYTFDAPSPLMNPGLSHSASPSPSPPRSYLQTPNKSRAYISSSPSTPTPSTLSQSPHLYAEPTRAAHGQQKMIWDFDAAFFGTPYEQLQRFMPE